MTEIEFHFNSLGINVNNLPKKDKNIFLSYMFTHLYVGLFEKFISWQEKYLKVIKQYLTMEEMMIEANFLVYVINDILSTEEYTLSGIAYYTQIPEEAIQDVFIGLNKNPSFLVWRKIIGLHSVIRKDFYRELIKKILFKQVDENFKIKLMD